MYFFKMKWTVSIVGIFLLSPFFVYAINAVELTKPAHVISSPSDIYISTDVSNPGPHQRIHATVQSVLVDTQIADIVWMVNGVIIAHKRGQDSFDFQTKELGEETIVTALVRQDDETMLVAEYRVMPTSIVIVFESEGYTPSFYKGRIRYSSGNMIRLFADVRIKKRDGSEYEPSELRYTWMRNHSYIKNGSAFGKNSIRIKGPKLLDDDLITVQIKSKDGKIRIENSTIVKTEDPKIVLYEDRPLIGAAYYDSLRTDDYVSGKELQLVVEPYFMDADKSSDSNIIYKWLLNKKKIQGIEDLAHPRFLIGDLAAGAHVLLSVKAAHALEFLQEAKTEIDLIIGESVFSNDLF